MNERPIPVAAIRDPDSVEMLRVWVAEKQLHSSLKIGMYRDGMGIDEEAAWGTILADTARHIARALHPENAEQESETLQKILRGVNIELAVPTSAPVLFSLFGGMECTFVHRWTAHSAETDGSILRCRALA